MDLIRLYPGDAWTIRKTRVSPLDGQGTASGNAERHERYSYAGVPIVLMTVECGSGRARAYVLDATRRDEVSQ